MCVLLSSFSFSLLKAKERSSVQVCVFLQPNINIDCLEEVLISTEILLEIAFII